MWLQIKPGLTETEVAALFEYEQRRGFRASFETIVASGRAALCPWTGQRLLQAGDLLVLDGGAVVDGYCGDFTRTIVVGSYAAETAGTLRSGLGRSKLPLAVRPGITGRRRRPGQKGY